jgi:hypothetical protein
MDDGIEEIMGRAVEKRNFLIHHFFRERAFEFVTASGRQRMIAELQETQDAVCLAEKLTNSLCLALASKIGIAPLHVEAEVERLRREAIAADCPTRP